MILHVKNIVKSFEEKNIIDNVDFMLQPASITAIAGRNGSGKTTILKMMAGILDCDEGCILIDEKNLKYFPKLKENIAYLPDRFNFFDFEKVSQVIEYYEIIYPKFDKEFVIREFNEIGISLDDRIRSFSKGSNSLVGLILILATNAQFVLVDEILDGMDVLNKEKIIGLLIEAADKGKSILVSSHELKELEGLADRIIYLSLDGKIREVESMGQSNLIKIQIVCKDSFPKDLENSLVLRQNIGRVYTVIGKGSADSWRERLDREEIVQYDFLSLKLEDFFYYERGVEKNDRHKEDISNII